MGCRNMAYGHERDGVRITTVLFLYTKNKYSADYFFGYYS